MESYKEIKQQVVQLPSKYDYELDFKKFADSDGFNYWFKIPEEKRKVIDDLIERLYYACLTLDDVYDDSKMRRGKPTSYYLYGMPLTVNSGLLSNIQILKDASKLDKPEAVGIILDGIQTMYEGQGMEIYWRDYGICPTKEEYKCAAIDKCCGLFICKYKLMQLFSDNKTDYSQFCKRLGLYYQFMNDNLALIDEKYQKKKGFLTDVTEGKYTPHIIHALEKEKWDPKLINILRKRTDNQEAKEFVFSLLKKHGSIEYVEEEIRKLKEELRRDIASFGGNPIFEKLENLEYYEGD